MEDFVRKSLLFDFYGELLTEHQKEVYRKYHAEDLSLAEIAEEYEVSRQAVHDLLKRCDKQLESYEKRLQLIRRFTEQREKILQIREIAGNKSETVSLRKSDGEGFTKSKAEVTDKVAMQKIYLLAEEILSQL